MRLAIPALVLLFSACEPGSGDDSGQDTAITDPVVQDVDFTCDESAVPEALPLRRLTRTQHGNTLLALAAELLPAETAALTTELQPALESLVPDSPRGPDKHFGRLSRMDQDVSQAHVDRGYDAAVAFARVVTEGGRLTEIAGTCDAAELACLRGFVERFGPVALRRPLTEAEVDHVLLAVQDDPVSRADWRDAITVLLLHPDHLYLVQSVLDEGEEPARLDAWSLASRLSYHLWQAPPDAELRAAAASGDLLDDAAYAAQVDRMLADPRAREAIREFISEWLGNTTLEALNSRIGTPVFDAFRGEYTPSDTLRDEMLAEVTDAVLWNYDHGGTWDDVLTDSRPFARTDGLATLYDAPTWDGLGEPPASTQDSRAGLITRPAFVATGSPNTRPIMKGVLIRKALLCDAIGEAPADVAGEPPALDEHSSTRQVVENLTGTGSCAQCHVRLINPMGFVTEDFDALGRPRTHQTLFDAEGNVVTEVPVDTKVDSYVSGSQADPVEDAHELTALLVESPKPRACLTRHWFRFTFGRMEDRVSDGCALAAVDEALDEGMSLEQALRAIALTDAFKRRSIGGW